jgi:hypothetical protein
MSDDLKTLEELLEELEVDIGPGADEEFWTIREFFPACIAAC